jgi:hypothetical protein
MKEMIPMFSDIMTKAISKIFIDPSTTARFPYLVFNLQTSSNDYCNVDHTLGLSFGTTLWKTKNWPFSRENTSAGIRFRILDPEERCRATTSTRVTRSLGLIFLLPEALPFPFFTRSRG